MAVTPGSPFSQIINAMNDSSILNFASGNNVIDESSSIDKTVFFTNRDDFTLANLSDVAEMTILGGGNINSALETTTDDIIVAAAELSARAYSDTHHKDQMVIDDINAEIHGWEPLEPNDLGFFATDSRFSKVGNGDGDLLRYDFENASATVGLTMLDGKRTLGIAFEGTNDLTTENGKQDLKQDLTAIKDYYDSLSIFNERVHNYIMNDTNNIEQVLVTGHSLGGAAAQSFMHQYGQNDLRFIGITFGSPGTIRSQLVSEERFMNIQHDDDLVVKAALLQPKYFVDGSIVKSVAKDSGHSLANYRETAEFIASKLDTELLFRDVTIGTDDSDSITGGLLDNELFIGFGGNDTIDGGSGVDTAIYTGPRSNYVLDKIDQDYSVSDQRAGSNNDGVDALDSIERIIFADSALALDVDKSAGTVAKLIGAIYGAESVANANLVATGLSEIDKGTSQEDLATLALGKAGANSPEQVVSLLWNNVAGAPPTADQTQPYIDDLNNGKYTAGTLGFLAAETPLNEANINLVGLKESGITFDPLVFFG